MPPDRIASAESAVRGAEQHGSSAPENASAQLHLRLARDELALAQQNFDKDARRAEMLLIRARVDAELAQAMASTTEAEQQAHETRLELDRLQASMSGNEKEDAS